MDDFCRARNAIPFIISGNRAHASVLDKDIPVIAVQGIHMAEAEDLSPSRRLTGRNMDMKKQALQKRFHFLHIRTSGIHLPLWLSSSAEAHELVLEPLVIQNALQQPVVAVWEPAAAVLGMLEEFPSISIFYSVVYDLVHIELDSEVLAVLVEMKKQQFLELILSHCHLFSNKAPEAVYT